LQKIAKTQLKQRSKQNQKLPSSLILTTQPNDTTAFLFAPIITQQDYK
jgi:hypothetical protein